MAVCIVDRLPGVQGIACRLLPIHHLLALLLLALHSTTAALMHTTVQALCWAKPTAGLCSTWESSQSQVHYPLTACSMHAKHRPTGLKHMPNASQMPARCLPG